MVQKVAYIKPAPIMVSSRKGPFCALPQDLDADLGLWKTVEGRELAVAAYNCLSTFEVGGKNVTPDEPSIARLTAAIEANGLIAVQHLCSLEQPNHRDYDAVFLLERTTNKEAGFAHLFGTGVLGIVNQLSQRNSLMPAEQLALISGMGDLLKQFAPYVNFEVKFQSKADLGNLPHYDPLLRWCEGHWAFFAICQSIIILSRRYKEAVEIKDNRTSEITLRAVIKAYRTLGNAFRLAGDITADEYTPIANSMGNSREGFSGLWFADHAVVQKEAKRLVDIGFPGDLGALRSEFEIEANYMYHCHVYVCELLTGERTSLAGDANDSSESAGNLLRKFARKALKLIKSKISL